MKPKATAARKKGAAQKPPHSRKPKVLPMSRKYWEERTNPQVAREQGCHSNTAARWRLSHGLPMAASIRRTDFRKPRVKYDRIRLNETARQNAARLGLKQSWVAQLMNRLRKLQGLPPARRGKVASVKREKPRGRGRAPAGDDWGW